MKSTILDKFKDDLENKKIAIWGLGKEGISTLQFIQNNNIKRKNKELEKEDLEVPKALKNNLKKENAQEEVTLDRTTEILNQINQYLDEEKKKLN